MTRLPLRSLHGQIHRFTGVVDRFGGFPQSGRIIQTVCIRELQLASTDQPLNPDHWWFRLREDWADAGIQPGDTVLFTAKVQRCTKGWDEPLSPGDGPCRRREQVMGLGGRIRDLVVTHRAQRHSLVLSDLQDQVRRQARLLAEAEAQATRLEIHRDALLEDVRLLQERLRLVSTRCRILDPGAGPRASCLAPRATRRAAGFARLGR
jgi:hypothetical protein